jgi:hypothetical protein
MTDAPQHRWFLRPWWAGALAAFVLLATTVAAVGSYAWRRTAVIAWIESTGGMVSYEGVPAWVPGAVVGDYPSLALPLERVLVGEFPDPPERLSVLHEARLLDLSHFPARDQHLLPLRHFRRLKSLDVQATGVTDAGLAPLRECPCLTELNLSGTQITDAGLALLVGLPLESLDLSETKVTNAGMATLRSLSKLSTLRLAGTAVDEDGLNELRGLSLTTLDLARTPIADRGLEALRSMPDLEEVNLGQTAVGDAEAAVLSDLARLHKLNLEHTRIKDAGLALLAKLPLESLNVSQTHVTNSGLARLSGQITLTFVDFSGTAVEYTEAEKFCGSRDMVANASGGGLRLYDRKAYRCARSCPPP